MSQIKQTVKKMIPQRVIYYSALWGAIKALLPDLKRRTRDKIYNNSEAEKVQRDLTLMYHIVEKGLTMPEPRPGFGKKVVLDLAKVILMYDKMNLPKDAMEFCQSISVLKEYDHFHKQIGFKLDAEVAELLDVLTTNYPEIVGEKQLKVTREAYFENTDKPFDVFCRSRYSVRNFTTEEIPISVLYKCIDLAQKSPSFCNRQPTRVHIVKSPDKKRRLMDIQNGNRGFGHLAETLLVVSSIISTAKDIHERNENHLNGGIFSMTLLNALHFYHIGACSLNWSVLEDREIEIRKILDIQDNEIVLMIIACGYLPNEIALASSPRKKAIEITTNHL